jgi:hypothetical protein
LARRLFDWELNGDWDVFSGEECHGWLAQPWPRLDEPTVALATYADVLGGKGLAAYRQLAEA